MLQRTKAADTSRLAVIRTPQSQVESKAPAEAEDRAPSPQTLTSAEAAKPVALKSNRKRSLLMGAAPAVLLAGGWFGYDYMTIGRFMVSTDDAYVRAYNTTLGAKVSGYVY